jgi:hypothetical protein
VYYSCRRGNSEGCSPSEVVVVRPRCWRSDSEVTQKASDLRLMALGAREDSNHVQHLADCGSDETTRQRNWSVETARQNS